MISFSKFRTFKTVQPRSHRAGIEASEKVYLYARVSFWLCNWLNADVPATFDAANQLMGRFLTTDLQRSVIRNGGSMWWSKSTAVEVLFPSGELLF
jgi:hypothetical protein